MTKISSSERLPLFSTISFITIPLQQLGKEFGNLFVAVETSLNKVEISESALAATAERTGVTVAELRAELETDGNEGETGSFIISVHSRA